MEQNKIDYSPWGTTIYPDCMTWYIQVKMSDNCNSGAVRLLYQYYAHIPWKHNSIYISVHIKHGGWQLKELLHLLNVNLCWWPAINKSVSPCDLDMISYSYFRTPCTRKSNCRWQNRRWTNVTFEIILYFKNSSAFLLHSYLQTRPQTYPLHISPTVDNSPPSILAYNTNKLYCQWQQHTLTITVLSGWHRPWLTTV